MNKIMNNLGFTLLELLISLAVLGILISAFLGIQVAFAKYNQISSSNLNTGIYAGNLYENAKGMSALEISEMATKGIIKDGNIRYAIEAEQYIDNNQSKDYNIINLVIHSDSLNNYTYYSYDESIHNLPSISGQGNLTIYLSSYEHHINIDITDEVGIATENQFITNKETQIINIYVDSKQNTEQSIEINIDRMPRVDLQIYIYESLFGGGIISINYDNQSAVTKHLIKPWHEENLSIYSRKSENNRKVPIYLKIMAFQEGKDQQPICRRQGIIWINP